MVRYNPENNNPYASPENDHDIEEELGEGLEELSYAGFLQRFAAYVIDNLIIIAILVGILFLFSFAMAFSHEINGQEFDPEDPTVDFMMNILLLVGSVFVGWLYFAVQESSQAQASLGKRMFGMKLVDEDGNRISFQRATGRHFAKILSSFFMIGYLIQPFQEKAQALHDKMAGTLVVQG